MIARLQSSISWKPFITKWNRLHFAASTMRVCLRPLCFTRIKE
jgi:hypothetical protein